MTSVLVLGISPASPGLAEAPRGAPAPAAGTQSQCAARVFDVVPLHAAAGAATTYVVSFESAGEAAGRLSGVVSFYSGNDRYDVHVADVVAAGVSAATLRSATPAVVSFPAPVAIDSAYLASLDGPDGGPCEAAYVWLKGGLPPAGPVRTVLAAFEDGLRRQGAAIAPIGASAAHTEPAPTCAHPNEPARIAHRAPVSLADSSEEAYEGVFITEVSISETGSVVDAWLWGWAGPTEENSRIATISVNEAKNSVYAPETFRCRRVPSIYLGGVSYKSSV